jgi:hypothetical protein
MANREYAEWRAFYVYERAMQGLAQDVAERRARRRG